MTEYEKDIEIAYRIASQLGETNNEAATFLTEFIYMRAALLNESHRGAALLSVSFLEKCLEEYLKMKLHGTRNFKNELFAENNALSTYSNKIKIAFATGLVTKQQFDDLNTIRKIRNEFAHSSEVIDFDTEKISSRIKSLKMQVDLTSNKPPGTIFLTVVVTLIGLILGKLHSESKYVLEKDRDEELLKFINESLKKLGFK